MQVLSAYIYTHVEDSDVELGGDGLVVVLDTWWLFTPGPGGQGEGPADNVKHVECTDRFRDGHAQQVGCSRGH